MKSMNAKLAQEHWARTAQGLPHPKTIFLDPNGYEYFIAAMRVVNARIAIPGPPDELYTFKGSEIRCGSG